jgi:hypothetical protein
MKKTIRIKENELVNLIDKMINENVGQPSRTQTTEPVTPQSGNPEEIKTKKQFGKFLKEKGMGILSGQDDAQLNKVQVQNAVNIINQLLSGNVKTTQSKQAFNKLTENKKIVRVSESKLVSLIENVVEETKKNKDKETSGFKHWMAEKSGNVVKNVDGTYSTQDAMWKNKIKDLEALKKYYEKHMK